jgi:thiol-disulfide isomerase/thioredoxin
MHRADFFNVAAYKAPEIAGDGLWFNSDSLKLADLKGKVVLVDFWTYSCINCIRSLPYIQAWYEAYKDDGFVVIGVHAPEFDFEKVPANVERAIQDRKLTYPVVQDNDLKTWDNFSNHYWPAHYLIDVDGRVRREHFGEGEYDETEKAIRALLAEAGGQVGKDMVAQDAGHPPIGAGQTPETYLGYERGANFANTEFGADTSLTYTLVDDLGPNEWSLGGKWQIGAMGSVAQDENSTLRIKFSAKEVYLVMDGPEGAAVTLKLDGKAVTRTLYGGADMGDAGRIKLDGARLYRLVNLPVFTKYAVLDITLPKGATVNAFTFGS